MSDFRRFCWAFIVTNGVITLVEWIVPPVHRGPADSLIVKFVLSFIGAATLVALWPSPSRDADR